MLSLYTEGIGGTAALMKAIADSRISASNAISEDKTKQTSNVN